jgi:hypothetical protein
MMIVTITSIELRSPLKFFALSWHALKIIKQLKGTDYISYKGTGIWTSHYTMTSWPGVESMKEFALSGAHREAMKKTAELAKEVRILTLEMPELPVWKTAKEMLKRDGKLLKLRA